MVGAFSFKETRHVLDERGLWVTPRVPDVDNEGDPAVVDDGLLPMSEQEWEEERGRGGTHPCEVHRFDDSLLQSRCMNTGLTFH